ncbi:IMPACT family protein [Chitinibacteraceae bacterium HSL-7]
MPSFTLAAAVTSELEIKKSRFLADVRPVQSRPEAQAIVDALRAQHPQAAHVCWALHAGGHSAAVDDGEPSGTAGRPMLEVLRQQQLDQVLAVVVRYFGGVKLGAGGLVRAYTDAVATALKDAERIERIAYCTLTFSVDYASEGHARRLLQQHDANLLESTHGHEVTLSAQLAESQRPLLKQALIDATQGRVHWLDNDDA